VRRIWSKHLFSIVDEFEDSFSGLPRKFCGGMCMFSCHVIFIEKNQYFALGDISCE
jgi:hypothetical protein